MKHGLKRAGRGLRLFVRRLMRQTRGNVAMMFAIALPVLMMITLGAIDLHHASKVKAELQDALDAAALAAARSKYSDDVNINRVGMAALKANMPGYFDKDGDTARFVLVDNRRVEAAAKVDVKVLVANVFLPPYGKLMDDYLPVSAGSEVLRASRNVEVALVLDITGSMAGSPLTSLKEAAKELVSLVVQKEQTPFSSRVALVPYSMGVNLGDYAEKTRGPLQQATTIDDADWADRARALSQVAGGVLTADNHGLKKDEYVWISGVNDASYGLNGRIHRVSSVTTDTFQLAGFSGSGSRNTGSFRRCWSPDCRVWVTSAQHTLSTGDWVKITGVQGMSRLNAFHQVRKESDDQFSVGLRGPDQSAYSRGGVVQCGYDGCQARYYIGRDNRTLRELPASTCVSERLWTARDSRGSLVPTDRTPDRDNWVGRNYPHSNNRCLGNTLTPLTSQVEDSEGVKGLNSQIDAYQAAGSTAGQIGIEWGWYAVSPNFNSVWPSDSGANLHDVSKTLKAIVLMTDGEFNNPYCQGVISRDAPSDGTAGNASFQINCSAPNGNPFAQSVALCEQMKKQNIVVYTVGFNLSTYEGGSGVDTAYEVMEQCATSKDHFFTPNRNTDLKEAFAAIGRDITRLRISG